MAFAGGHGIDLRRGKNIEAVKMSGKDIGYRELARRG